MSRPLRARSSGVSAWVMRSTVLLDDRPLVEIGGDEMGGRADQLDAARVRLVVGLGPL